MSVIEAANRIWAEPGETAREIGLTLHSIGRRPTEYVNDEGETVITIEMRGEVSVTATYVDQEFEGTPLHAAIAFHVGEHTYPISSYIGTCAGLAEKLAEITTPEGARRQMVSAASHEGFTALKPLVGSR